MYNNLRIQISENNRNCLLITHYYIISLNFIILVDGSWTEWSDWETCSKECGEGGGAQTRYRYCSNPPPLNGGRDCDGDNFDVQPCNDFPCKYSGEINVSEYNDINNEGGNCNFSKEPKTHKLLIFR